MRAAIAQVNPRIGDLAYNKKKALESIEAAKRAGAALVIFPELMLTGYPPRDLLDYPALVEGNLAVLAELATQARGITVVCGFVEPNSARTGRPWRNAAGVLAEGRVQTIYRKQLLPYYDVFDEERYFEPGGDGDTCVVTIGGLKVGITICEDLWNAAPYLARPYEKKPLEALLRQKPDVVVNLSASPFHVGKPALRERLFGETAAQFRAPVLFCNQVGANDDLIFDGSSFAIAPTGAILAQGPAFAESLVLVELPPSAQKNTTSPAPGLRPTSEEAWLEGALTLGIRDYTFKCGAQRLCLGLSGGIDSSVVAALAVSALGPQAVELLAMPSRYSAPASLEDAKTLATRLGCPLHTLSIEPLFSLYRDQWKLWFGKEPQGVTLENLQPRIRMTLLMAFANERGSLLLNTSNKSEIACGYATLYGDSAGALSVLGDLTKGQVYALARFLNRQKELIPQRVIDRAPSAELRENQTDQDTLPPYSVLDTLVRQTVEGFQSPADLIRAGQPADSVRSFGRLHAQSEYKRRQLPPVLRVSPHAFGVGRRVPIASAKPWEG